MSFFSSLKSSVGSVATSFSPGLLNSRSLAKGVTQYLSSSEVTQVALAAARPAVLSTVQRVQEGNWGELLREKKGDALSYQLIAAYEGSMIDDQDLATGMLFQRVHANSRCRIVPIRTDVLDHPMWERPGPLNRELMLAAASKSKPNQQFMVLASKKDVDPYTKSIFNATFGRGQEYFGYLQSKDAYGILAFGPLKAYYPELSPVIHLTPDDQFVENIRANQSDFSLFFPGEEVVVHGSCDKTLFSQVHDLFHASARRRSAPVLMALLDRIKTVPVESALQAAYQKKQTSGVNELYPSFHTLPTLHELGALIIDRMKGDIVDGGYPVEAGGSQKERVQETLRQIAEKVLSNEFQKLAELNPSADLFEKCRLLVKEKLGLDYL